MPHFCRHNRLVQNCPICSREGAIELRPLMSSSAPRVAEPRPTSSRRPAAARRAKPAATAGVTVRRVRQSTDDGFRSPLVPGLKASHEARRLADELAFAQTRLQLLSSTPPGLYAEVADRSGDLEERIWLAFLIAYLGPLEAAEDPFAAIRAIRTTWESGATGDLSEVATGPRTARHPDHAPQTIEAYRAWAKRAGSQQQAVEGDSAWPPERRFARAYERLALPDFHRAARFEFLVSLGALGVCRLEAAALGLGGSDQVSVAAKRALGIADPVLLERRAGQLAAACGVALSALDLGLYNWERGERARLGVPAEREPDQRVLQASYRALGL